MKRAKVSSATRRLIGEATSTRMILLTTIATIGGAVATTVA